MNDIKKSRAIPQDLSPDLKNSPNQDAKDCIMPMGITSENVAEEYKVDRKRQDEFSVQSHLKAAKAYENGWYERELVPIQVKYIEKPKEDGLEPTVTTRTLAKDEGVRPQSTMESLGKLRPAFKENGTSTAGNSSQISDGASAVTLVRRDVAERLGLKPIGRFIGLFFKFI